MDHKILLEREVLGQALNGRVPRSQRMSRVLNQYLLSSKIKNKRERGREGVHSFLLNTYSFEGFVLDAGDSYLFLPDSTGWSCDKAIDDCK